MTAVKVQRARELRRDMTPEEALLWQALRRFRPRGYTFRRQQIISGFIADFYCFQARLVIEVDGGIHREQVEYDAARDAVIAAHGLHILRIPNDAVRDHLDHVLQQIATTCQANSSHPLSLRGEGVRG